MLLRSAAALVLLLCAACGGSRANSDHAGFVAACNARLAEIRTANGRFRAESALDGRIVRTQISGDRRDEVGDAIAAMYATMRSLAREGGYDASINAGSEQPALTWNGRTVSCRLATVVFAP